MSATHRTGHTQQHTPPGRFPDQGLTSFALILALFLTGLLVSPATSAQEAFSKSNTSLVYVADSANQRLNLRLRELLAEAFGGSVKIRSFVSGQTSQDAQTPVIAIGPGAFNRVRQENKQVPLLGLLVDQSFVTESTDQSARTTSAVLSDPPLMRQAAIGKAILPYSSRVAMLARPETGHLYDSAMENLERLGMQGRVFLVPSDERLIPTLIRALNYGDFILAAPDNTIYNPRTIKHILLTAYRRNRIVIGPSQAYVKAGSLASSYTPLSEVATMAADYVQYFREHDEFPEPAYPVDFGIEVNRQVGRSLNIALPERQNLIDAVMQNLEDMGALTDE